MASAYSDDLRRKFFEAYQRGDGSLAVLAGRFGVSVSWAEKLMRTQRQTGRVERPPGGKRGPASKLTAELRERIRAWIEARPDLTLAELQLRLWERQELEVSLSRLWTVLDEMGLYLKKVTPCRRARYARGPFRAQCLVAGDQPDRSVEADFPGRERCHHRNDPALRPRPAWRACGRRYSLRPLANVDRSRSDPRFRMGGHHDH